MCRQCVATIRISYCGLLLLSAAWRSIDISDLFQQRIAATLSKAVVEVVNTANAWLEREPGIQLWLALGKMDDKIVAIVLGPRSKQV